MRESLRILCVWAAVSVGHAWAAANDLPLIRLDTVFPPGAQAGTEATVNITGDALDEAGTLLFSHPGLSAESKGKGFVVRVAADVPPGVYDVRVSGLFGVSNPRAFAVGLLPEKSVGNSYTPGKASELPLDTVVSGVTVTASANYYKFTAKKGQRLLIECTAAEIDSRLTPVLAVLDRAGNELEASHRGGLVDFTAPDDGGYLLQLHDLVYAGNPNCFFRLAITTGPHLDFILPAVAQAGTKGKFALYGRHLPGGAPTDWQSFDGKPLEKLEVEIDAPAAGELRADGLLAITAAGLEGFSYRLKSPQGTSNALFIGLSATNVVAEIEPNNQPAQAQKITPPCEIAGQFYPAGDVDGYTFEAKKGDIWWIEVLSSRLGLPTNPFLLVQRDGKDVQEAYAADPIATEKRYATTSNDPACRFEAKEDGTYRISVRDLFGGARRDPANVYQLSIHRETADFRLAALYEPPAEKPDDRTSTPRAALLRPSGTIPIKVVAFRRNGFAGDIELTAEGLPAGITCQPMKIPVGKNEGVLLLTAGEKPEKWVGPIRLVGQAKAGDTEVVREVRGGVIRWLNTDFDIDRVQSRLTRELMLAVSAADAAPITIEPAEDKLWEAPVGGKLEIPLKITRRGEFKEPLKLKPAGAPGLEALKETEFDAKTETGTATLDLAAAKLPAGPQTIYFQALTKGKFRGKDVTTTIFSTPIRIEIKTPDKK